jgi:hypothetical protein
MADTETQHETVRNRSESRRYASAVVVGSPSQMLRMLVPTTRRCVDPSSTAAWFSSGPSPPIHSVWKPICSISRAMAAVIR